MHGLNHCVTSKLRAGFRPALTAPRRATLATVSLLVKEFQKCVFTYGPGYRVYFAQRGLEIVILLAGGDKGTQDKDIKIALGLAQQTKE